MEPRRRRALAVAVAMVVPHGNQVTAAFQWTDLSKYAMALAGIARKIPAA